MNSFLKTSYLKLWVTFTKERRLNSEINVLLVIYFMQNTINLFFRLKCNKTIIQQMRVSITELMLSITKTLLYNFDPLKPNFIQ